MKHKLERRYGWSHLHFITCSCYRRLPFFASPRARNIFLAFLNHVRDRYDFALHGHVVMPEHIHILIGEPAVGNPSLVMQVLKQSVSRELRILQGAGAALASFSLTEGAPTAEYPRFWQYRFYDFNVWNRKKKNEKLNYMHFNPVKRGLVEHPKEWVWSSYRFYWMGEKGLCPPNPGWQPRGLANQEKERPAHPFAASSGAKDAAPQRGKPRSK